MQSTDECRLRESDDRAGDHVIERLANLMIDADELLDMTRREKGTGHSIEPHVRKVLEELDAAMRTVSD